jgi:hypothetical protein
MSEAVFMKLGTYVTAPEPISTVYFLNVSHQPVCLYLYRHIIDRQRFAKNVTVPKNTYATIEALCVASCCMPFKVSIFISSTQFM